ncbi:DUF6316 family protein [bacterium]|nr:DUF6316 family protein [bacterium]
MLNIHTTIDTVETIDSEVVEMEMDMSGNRDGELGSNVPMRSERFYLSNGSWYFATREGAPMGPFDSKVDARQGLDDFLEFMSLAEPRTLMRLYNTLNA